MAKTNLKIVEDVDPDRVQVVGSGVYFHRVEEGTAVLRRKGQYTTHGVYVRGETLYAKKGASYIRLMKKGTSIDDLNIDALELPFQPRLTNTGVYLAPKDWTPEVAD